LGLATNSIKISWNLAVFDDRLDYIVTNIHENFVQHGTGPDGYVDYL
jgi:hypothetical protein